MHYVDAHIGAVNILGTFRVCSLMWQLSRSLCFHVCEFLTGTWEKISRGAQRSGSYRCGTALPGAVCRNFCGGRSQTQALWTKQAQMASLLPAEETHQNTHRPVSETGRCNKTATRYIYLMGKAGPCATHI